MNAMREQIIAEAKRLAYAYPERSQKEKIKRMVKSCLRPDTVSKDTLFSWPQAMLTMGLLEIGERDFVGSFYQKYIDKGCPIRNIETCMHGQILLSLWESCEDKEKKIAYKETIDKLYQYLESRYEKYEETIPYNENHSTYILVDGIGMVVPFLSKYGRVFQNEKALEMAGKQLERFWNLGMDSVSGLPYHGYDSRTKMKYGIIGWGRAVGWLLWGIADSLEYFPIEIQSVWQERLERLLDKSMEYKRPDGGFSWQLQAVESYYDSSATAMIGVACKKSQSYTTYTDAIEQSLENYQENGKILGASAECIDFAQYPQVYGSYPWSVGSYLRLVSKTK